MCFPSRENEVNPVKNATHAAPSEICYLGTYAFKMRWFVLIKASKVKPRADVTTVGQSMVFFYQERMR